MIHNCNNCANSDGSELDVCTTCVVGVGSGPSNWDERAVEDVVNHPNHYMSETGLETIDVIEAFTFDLKGIEAVDTANILKYICRWKKKNGLQDLKKAQWYLNHLINHVETLEKENN